MEMLKRYFPFSFKEKNEIKGLAVNVLVYLVAALAVGLVIGLFSGVPVINWIFGIVGILAEIYALCGIVLSVVDYMEKAK